MRLVGLEGALVEVEVDIAPGLPNFFVVGVARRTRREARERAPRRRQELRLQIPLQARGWSTWPPPTSRKKAPPRTCPSPWASSWPRSSSPPTSPRHCSGRAVAGRGAAPHQRHTAHGGPGPGEGADPHHRARRRRPRGGAGQRRQHHPFVHPGRGGRLSAG